MMERKAGDGPTSTELYLITHLIIPLIIPSLTFAAPPPTVWQSFYRFVTLCVLQQEGHLLIVRFGRLDSKVSDCVKYQQ